MSVLIKGMEMPDCGYVCLKVFANGNVPRKPYDLLYEEGGAGTT